jgi:hypothetical protein
MLLSIGPDSRASIRRIVYELKRLGRRGEGVWS